MVVIGLVCVLALAVGINLGLRLRDAPDPDEPRPDFAFTFPPLIAAYVIGVFVEGTMLAIAPSYPSIRQIITTLDTARLGVLFLIMRRLCSPTPRWGMLAAVLGVEIIMGITGFFAGFREPIVLCMLAVLEVFDRRNKQHWVAVTVAVVSVSVLGLIWMGIRRDYRREYVEVDQFRHRAARVERASDLTSFLKGDPPRSGPPPIHCRSDVDGLLSGADRTRPQGPADKRHDSPRCAVHIVTPRVFFPEKPELMSDSDKVRRYSGVRVAGRESNTSIAFGYSAEAYIDFGVPLMFLPVFAFGIFIGAMYALFRSLIWHRELFVAFGTVAFWLSAYLFERSWATMLGVSVGFMVYLGLPTLLLDRFLLVKFARDQKAAGGDDLMFDTLKHDRA